MTDNDHTWASEEEIAEARDQGLLDEGLSELEYGGGETNEDC